MVGILVGHAMAFMHEPTEIYKTGLHTNALLESLSEVVIAWLLLRHAQVAHEALPEADAEGSGVLRGQDRVGSLLHPARHAQDRCPAGTRQSSKTATSWR